MRSYYIFKSGRLKRKDNSVIFTYTEDGKNKMTPIPINDIDTLYLFGEIDLNTKLHIFLSQHNVMAHFFNYYGYYAGTFYPREFLNSGDILVRQVKHYTGKKLRLTLAYEFVKGAAQGSVYNLTPYRFKINKELETIKKLMVQIDKQPSISAVMGIEGNIKEMYYQTFTEIINQKIEFKKRVKHPPDNMMNALISFVNSVIYTEVLREIYKTQLNPTISYLHEPGYRRFSLALDVAEIFKPVIGDHVIISLLNNRQLQKKHFDKELNYAYLLEEGRKIVIRALDEKLSSTIYVKTLKRKVGYRQLIRLELYKIIKHLLGEKEYQSFKATR